MSKVRFFGHSLLWVFTVSLILLAVFIATARFILEDIPAYKNDLEVYLSEEMAGDVQISGLSARMEGFKPQLSLKKVRLDELNRQTNTLSIGEIRLSFNPLNFFSGDLKPSQITLVDSAIKIKRLDDGRFSIIGLSSDQESGDSSGDFSWLLEGRRFEIIDSQIIWQDDLRDLPDVTLDQAHVVFQNNGQEHTLKVIANMPKETGGSFVLAIEVIGDVLSTADWSAKAYFKAKKIKLNNYLSRLNLDKFSIQQGEGDIELWSHWEAAALSQVKGSLVVKEARLQQEAETLKVSNFSGQFAWNKLLNGWSLYAKNLAFKTEMTEQEQSQFNVRYRAEQNEGYSISAAVDGINLEAMSHLLQYSKVLDPSFLSVLKETKVSGLLNKANFSVHQGENSAAWAACGEFEKVSTLAYGLLPKMSHFSGTGCSTQDKGWLNLAVKEGSIYFQGLFRDPILVDSLDGQLTWAQDEKGWLINTNHIGLNSPHVKTRSRMMLHLPTTADNASIDLQTHFSQADSRFTSQYLPVGIMDKEVVHWLDKAFIAGDIKEGGGLLFKGPLSDFPFRQNNGVSQVLFETENVHLHYGDRWPDVIDLAAEVEFKNQGMKVFGQTGSISGNNIEHVFVEIKDFKTDPYLRVKGQLNDDISGLYAFFKQSPLKERLSTLLKHSKISGPSVIELDLGIPLRKKLEETVAATLHLQNNTLVFPNIDLAINDIQGQINYDEQGLSGAAIKGRFLGEQLDATIRSDGKKTVILGQSHLNIAQVSKEVPSDLWAYVDGRSLAKIKVDFPHTNRAGKGGSTITLSSDLEGVSVDLPAPVGKPKNTKKSFEAVLKIGGNSLPVSANYGDELKTHFLFNEKTPNKFELGRADIHFGATKAALPERSGVQLSGTLKQLNISDWQKALGFEKDQTVSYSIVNQVNLNVHELHWLDTLFEQVHVTGHHKNSIWSGTLSGRNFSGKYQLPDDLAGENKISLDLDVLKLPSIEGGAYRNKKSPLNPAEVPNIDLSSKEFFIGTSQLGELAMALRRKTNGMVIERLSLTSARDNFKANGAWEVNTEKSVTGLKGRLNSQSLGSLLKEAGMTSKLKDAPADIYFDLNWLGDPQDFSKDFLNGYVELKSEQGRLLDIEPGIGRVFGLLSLNTIQRRLQLDFSDLVQKGLSFDKIKGRFNLLNGVANTDRFYLESPSSRLDFQGQINLAKEELNQLITVTPKTTENLPLAGAIAGGPLVGAAVYIVQKIAGKTVNQLTGYQYQVSGPWRDPKVKQISQPGGKIFGMVGDALTPVLDATMGQSSSSKAPSQSLLE